MRLTIEAAPLARTAEGKPPSTPPSRATARKSADSSLDDRLMPSRTTGAVKPREATISSATVAPMLNPTTTSAPTSIASSDVSSA